MSGLVITLIVVGVLLLAVAAVYNSLIRSRNRVDEAWSDIDVQLKRRYDLIPNLIETVKGYAKHEKEVFEKVTKARTEAMGAQTVGEKDKAENVLSGALKSLFAVAEAYPDLKANENFGKLQDELTDTEDKIQASRRFYNGNVRDFNTKIQVFPTNLFAQALGFKAYDFFEVENEAEKENIKVDFEEK
jgi:LemA protein